MVASFAGGFPSRWLTLTVCGLVLVGMADTVSAANKSWTANNTASGNATDNLNLAGNWSAGLPGNGDAAFMVWSRPSAGGPTIKIVTNAASDVFFADSLSLTNTGKDNVLVYVKGVTYLTNGVGRLNFTGPTGAGDIALSFSNSVTFNTVSFTGGSGSGNATLTFAGALAGQDFTFNGGTGNNFLRLGGPLGLSGALTVTNLNASSSGTLSTDATIGRAFINNASNSRFVITNSTTTVTGAVASVVGGFTLANDATLTLAGSGGLILSNVAPVLRGTINVNNKTLAAQLVWTNSGTINLSGGNITGLMLHNAGRVAGAGTITAPLRNTGTVAISAPGMTFSAVVTNAGRMAISGGTAVFDSHFVLAASGVLTADAGSVLKFRGDFINGSTQSNAFDLLGASVFFDGGAGNNTQQFTVAGLDLGADVAGYSNNFAIGSFTVGGSVGILRLVGNAGRALYVSNLTVTAGSTLLLNGFTVYAMDSPVIEGNVITGGGQLVMVPEPSALALVGAGLLLLILGRRKAKANALPQKN